MLANARDFDRLLHEHCAMLREHARVQARCTALLQEQARRIAALDAQVVRLRAAVVARDSALAWEREDRAALERDLPGLARRVDLGRRVAALQERVAELQRERLREPLLEPRRERPPPPAPAPVPAQRDDALEASLGAADLVICQTGCLSHGDYWRVQDHCKRTGKACVLVAQPQAVRIVRIHAADDGAGRVISPAPACPR
ncbi:DUF2325 domain-containing protein [uncultured Massilia sp.]|uniref:DUF2325 domain-containing protein n=1 Tax=uncultured Massilia sp. TaxID=169973 RepID=UPI0025E4C456|nr:DUF2325 domain-containing protein [uncultured Massilia sp.]